MKKRYLLMTVMTGVLLLFGSTVWAGEAHVFDSSKGILIRVFTTGDAPNISAYLEARDEEGVLFDGFNDLEVTKLQNGNPAHVYEAAEWQGQALLIHGPTLGNALSSPDVSMSFDSQTGITYVVCTDNRDMTGDNVPDPHVMKFTVAEKGVTPPPTCTYTYSGWGTCQANGTQSRTYTATPEGCTGTPVTSQTCTPPCTGFTYSDWGTCQANGTQTRTVISTTPAVCTGGTTSVTSQTCTPPPTNGTPDLTTTAMSGIPSSYDEGSTYNLSLTVANKGDASSGPWTLTIYQNNTYKPGGVALFTQSMASLNPGQSYSTTIPVRPGGLCSPHSYCYFIVMPDSDYRIVEKDEANNKKTRESWRVR